MSTVEQDKEMETRTKKENNETKEHTKIILSYLHDLVCLIAAVMLLFSFCFRVVVVSGPSMNNTLYDGDCLLVLGRVFYTEPKQGDIVVISKASFRNGTPIIKRVIATEGHVVDIDFETGVVYVDGEPLDEPYTHKRTYRCADNIEFPVTVSENCVFVLGDNRDVSQDSRSADIGLIDNREILGKAIFLFFPGANNNHRDISRIGGLTD